jgi:lactoylglutathione lyase
MKLGAFSVSLAVKDLDASKSFYQKLGFEVVGGSAEQHYLIIKNGEHVLGLFEGMFDKNMLTFNPGWSQSAEVLVEFTDVRDLQRELEARGIELQKKADPQSAGPESLMLVDPDGNPILIDQHV